MAMGSHPPGEAHQLIEHRGDSWARLQVGDQRDEGLIVARFECAADAPDKTVVRQPTVDGRLAQHADGTLPISVGCAPPRNLAARAPHDQRIPLISGSKRESGVEQTDTKIIAIGGFPGSGKSSVAGRLAAELRIPLLGSDLLGNTIKSVLEQYAPAPVPSSVAFRAGYASLFALVQEFVAHRCSVVVDVSLGWPFQWDELDAITGRHPDVRLRPFILTCPRQTCLDRLHERHVRAPQRHPPVEEFLHQPQLEAVARLLATIERPDVRRVDADRPLPDVLSEVLDRVRDAHPAV